MKTLLLLLLSCCLWAALTTRGTAAINLENLLGRYEIPGAGGNLHAYGTLTIDPIDPNKLRWTDDYNRWWTLTPDLANGILRALPGDPTDPVYGYSTPLVLNYYTEPAEPLPGAPAVTYSTVKSFTMEGVYEFPRKFTVQNDYSNTTANSNFLIDGPFIAWWALDRNYAADAKAILATLGRTRDFAWRMGMLDASQIIKGHYVNVYISDDRIYNSVRPFGWRPGPAVWGDAQDDEFMAVYQGVPLDEQLHESMHIWQFGSTSSGFAYGPDNIWYAEASATYYQGLDPTQSLYPYRMSEALTRAPHEAMWSMSGRQYAQACFLRYLALIKGVSNETIFDGYKGGLMVSPTQHFMNLLGASTFRQYVAEYAARNAGGYDYATPGDIADIYAWPPLSTMPDNRYVHTRTNSGTEGAWIRPAASLAPRGWGYNVVRVINTAAASYTLTLDGDATGSEGAPSILTGTAVIKDPGGNLYVPFTMNSNNVDGSVTVTAPSTATDVFFVINAVPDHFTGSQTYSYKVKIDRSTVRTNQLITAGSTWKYSANGTAAPADWAQPGFDDDGWPSGPAMLGYSITGLTPATTINNTSAITTYYRHSFTLTNPSQLRKLTLNLLRDDGAVVWLNGVELHRSNMPAAPATINSTTPALSTVAGADEAVIHTSTHTPAANILVAGTNVIAVELHQASTTTGDLGFDLSLDAEFEIPSYYKYGAQSTPFTITASDQARAIGNNLGTFNNNTGDMGIYWRGVASDATYMHFDFSSLAGGVIASNVSLNQTVDAQHGGNITGGQISTANAAWTGTGSTPGFTAIGDSLTIDGTYTAGSIASWTLSNTTFQGFVDNASTFNGLVLSGASGSQAHFSGLPSLTGTVTTDQIFVSGATDWTAASFNPGSSTLSVLNSNSVTGGNVMIKSGATLSVLDAATLGAGNFAGSIANTGTLVFGSSSSQTLSGVISGIGALHKFGAGALILTGANTYTGTTTISAGTLKLGAPILTENFSASGTPNTFDLNYNLSNRQTGSAATESWTPTNNAQVGESVTPVQQPPGTNGDFLLLANGGQAKLQGLSLSSANVPGPLKISFDMFKGNTGNPFEWTSFTLTASGNGYPVAYSGELGFLYQQNTGIRIFNNGVAIADFATTSGGDSFGFYLTDSAGTGSPFAGNGTRVVVTQGAGILGTYTLDTGMGASLIAFGSDSNMIGGVDNLAVNHFRTNVLSPATPVSLTASGTALELDAVYQTVASLSGVSGSAVNLGPFSLLTVNNAASTSFDGVISGNFGALTKNGSGTLTLTGDNTYTGPTTITGGSLVVTGTLGATAVTANSQTTLAGNGNIGGDVTIAPDAHHSLAVAADAASQITRAITGTLTLTSGNILDLTVTSTPASGVYVLATATVAINGTPTTINYNGINGSVSVDNASSPKRLLLTVANANSAPVASAQSVSVVEDTTKAITLAASDLDGNPLSFTVVAQPAHGTLSGTAPNLTYAPAFNYNGSDSFTFRVNDGTIDSAIETVSITVTAANDLPVFTANPIAIAGASEGVAYTGQSLSGTATDADASDTLTYSKVSGPAWLVVAPSGSLSGTPTLGSAGLNSFVVRVTDSAAAISDATLQITVTVLPLPWLKGDIGTGMLAGSVSYNAGTFTQAGSGILGTTTDNLSFSYQALAGDGEIIAKISVLQNTGTTSRVGVMIRDTLASNSKQIFMGMSGSNTYRWVRRTTTGGSNTSTTSSTGTVPNTWVRLVRSGTTITAYKSTNGTAWTSVGSTTNTTFASNCYIGLAISSGSNTTLNTSQFTNLSVTP